MKCYNHHDRDAFGICRSCGKALCLECMSHTTKNVVCANDPQCLYKDQQTENMYKNAGIIYSKKSINMSKLTGVGYIILGLTFGVVAYFMNFDIIMGIFALFFIMLGVVTFKKIGNLVAQDENNKK